MNPSDFRSLAVRLLIETNRTRRLQGGRAHSHNGCNIEELVHAHSVACPTSTTLSSGSSSSAVLPQSMALPSLTGKCLKLVGLFVGESQRRQIGHLVQWDTSNSIGKGGQLTPPPPAASGTKDRMHGGQLQLSARTTNRM